MSAARSPRSGRAPRTDPLAWRRTEPGPLMLLKGPEDYVARWVRDRVTAALRARHESLEVHDLRAGEYQAGQLAMAASPSLFAEPTLIRVDGLESMNDAFLADALRLVEQGPGADEVTLVLRHTGGSRGKRLLDAVAKAGTVVDCAPLKRDEDRLALVQAEFREARRRVDEDAARAVSLVRHALATGVHPVMITSALTLKARQVARIIDAGREQGELASLLGVAPFQVRYVQQAARHWTPAGIAQAVEWIAQADAEVKGASRNPDFAVERAVIRIATAVRR